jgi:radical SAM superfamily enzyme YgiQ (UPF0313 family)
MNKKQNIENVKIALGKIKKVGINVLTCIIIGHPGSSYNSDLNTLEYVKELYEQGLIDEIVAGIFTPFPGTKSSLDPKVRIIERNMSEWTIHKPVHELVDKNGKVIYSIEEMSKIYELYKKFRLDAEEKNHESSVFLV